MGMSAVLMVLAMQSQMVLPNGDPSEVAPNVPAPSVPGPSVPGQTPPAASRPASTAPALDAEPLRSIVTRAPAAVDVRSQMGKHFRFVEATVFVDGSEVFHRAAKPGEELERAFRAYDGTLTPGSHEVSVTLGYVGRNTGPFTYLDDYHYRLAATSKIEVTDLRRPAAVDVVATERTGFNIPIDKRPSIELKAAPGSAVTPVTVVRSEGNNNGVGNAVTTVTVTRD